MVQDLPPRRDSSGLRHDNPIRVQGVARPQGQCILIGEAEDVEMELGLVDNYVAISYMKCHV